jgi:hypothetical protein
VHAEADIVVDAELPVREAASLAEKLRAEAHHHLPALAKIQLSFIARPPALKTLGRSV